MLKNGGLSALPISHRFLFKNYRSLTFNFKLSSSFLMSTMRLYNFINHDERDLVEDHALQQSRKIEVDGDSEDRQIIDEERCKFLRKVFASAHINMLLGSGFSVGVVPTLGHRESWFQSFDALMRENPTDAILKTARGLLRAEYFKSVMLPLEGKQPDPLQVAFISAAMQLVASRGATLLPKRVNFFTTNYDPMIESSLETLVQPFNDGFTGRMCPAFDTSSFSRLMYEQSLFMEYSSQVATANVFKVHGSLTWRRQIVNAGIGYSSVDDTLKDCLINFENLISSKVVEEVGILVQKECDDAGANSLRLLACSLSGDDKQIVNNFANQYDATLCIVNPAKKKFEETVLEQSYYDLLRIYANELDRNNSLLMVFGFSFADEHILGLTKRAIRSNPQLIVIISCYTREDATRYQSLFPNSDNVYLLIPTQGSVIGLRELSEVLKCAVK